MVSSSSTPPTSKPKKKFFGLVPSMRWVPSDIPSPEASKKAKGRNPFSLKASAPDHGSMRPRKSTISIPEEGNMESEEMHARTHAQGQSMFFARLPIELRRMVYEYIVGRETVHLTLSTKRRFGHFICDNAASNEDEVGKKECACRVLVGGRKSTRLDIGGVGMVRACRRMYTESIPHLYAPHTFSLLHITHLLYLPSSLPQPRLNSLRTLCLRWAIRALPYLRRGPSTRIAYREDTANWERGWRIIASMTGLRDLYVVLVDPSPQQMWERNWLELEDRLLESVREVGTRGRMRAEVVLPYESCGVEWDMGDSCVELKRPEIGVVKEEGGDED